MVKLRGLAISRYHRSGRLCSIVRSRREGRVDSERAFDYDATMSQVPASAGARVRPQGRGVVQPCFEPETQLLTRAADSRRPRRSGCKTWMS